MKMQAHRVINWLLHYLGSRHPLAYFGLYLAMVPLFAAIYTSLNDGFYAPYAKYEKASTIELQRLRHALEAALQKYLKQRLIELEESGEILEYENYKLKSDELSVGIERLDITENITIRFLIYFSHSEKTETAAVFTNISLPFQLSSFTRQCNDAKEPKGISAFNDILGDQ